VTRTPLRGAATPVCGLTDGPEELMRAARQQLGAGADVAAVTGGVRWVMKGAKVAWTRRPLPRGRKGSDGMAGSQEILDGLRRLEETLYQRLSAELAAFRLEVNRRLDAIEVRLDRLETENQMIMVALRRLEETLAQDRSERAELRRDIVALRGKLSEVDVRITEIETKPNQ
jgi:hypothetical protein